MLTSVCLSISFLGSSMAANSNPFGLSLSFSLFSTIKSSPLAVRSSQPYACILREKLNVLLTNSMLATPSVSSIRDERLAQPLPRFNKQSFKERARHGACERERAREEVPVSAHSTSRTGPAPGDLRYRGRHSHDMTLQISLCSLRASFRQLFYSIFPGTACTKVSSPSKYSSSLLRRE